MARSDKPTISAEDAHDELQKILGFKYADTVSFQRANFCMRVLGCPIQDNGKFRVVEDQKGRDTQAQWDAFEDERDKINELHGLWQDMQ